MAFVPSFVLDEGEMFVKVRYKIVRKCEEFPTFERARYDVGHEVVFSRDMVRDHAGAIRLVHV